ncbi:HET-domain-containing protein [Apiospora marii]|uniref:HET-domain-containing protein n=1 Tax=Apiospora marii TaxID=335849 RepID=UPI0031310532
MTTAETSAPSPPSCPVCSKIVQVLNTPVFEYGEAALGKVHDILAHECGHADWLRDVKYHEQGEVPRYESRELKVRTVPGERGAWVEVPYMKHARRYVESPSLIFELVFRPDVPNHKGTARILDREWIDMDLVKDWSSRCFREHGLQCDTSSVQPIRPFYPQRLIDVGRGCVVPCPEEEGPRYATLSYTWGRTANFRITRANADSVERPGALLHGPITTQIPQTIHNAIQLTKALGLRWLWVDSLCIVQDDAATFSHQLRNMHHIYATSALTIMAKDGQDAGYGLRGLRGISAPRSTQQLVVPLAGGETVIMMESEMDRRPPSMFDYEQRMWTFQEGLFAKRRLIFEQGVVGWQCECASWYEHQPYHPEADRLNVAKGYERRAYEDLQKNPPNLQNLSHLVYRFNQRTLGFDEDVSNAFSGLQTCLNNIFPSGLVLGHPEFFFEISLCWRAEGNLRRRRVSEAYTGDPVRTRLPSWSWMGWQGLVDFPFDQEHAPFPVLHGEGFTRAVAQWHVLPTPGSTTKHPIDSMWHRYREGMPEELPDGWRREAFKPPLEWTADPHHYKIRFDDPGSMPRDLPAHTYIPTAKEEHPSSSRWYPVPLGDSNLASEDEDLNSHREFQYLRCLTSRAYLHGSPDETRSITRWDSIALIEDSRRNPVGGLRVHHEDDRTFLANGPMIELMAVARGWTTELESYLRNARVESLVREDVGHLTLEQEEAQLRHWAERRKREGSRTVPWERQWEKERGKKQDCYHVLWIEWERGVAYRRGSGFVLADRWEELAEADKVEVTLG